MRLGRERRKIVLEGKVQNVLQFVRLGRERRKRRRRGGGGRRGRGKSDKEMGNGRPKCR